MSTYPFRFQGAAPAEFEDGFPPFLVRFASEPDAPTRDAISASFKAGLGEHGLRSGDSVKWDGGSALFVFDERVDYDVLFDAAAAIMRGIHAVHPIDEVIFLNATPPCDDAWTSWSVAQQPHPAPGPRFGFECPFD